MENRDLIIWSMTTQTCITRYSSPDPIRTYDIHPRYIAILGRTGSMILLCRQTFQPICQHQLNQRTESISISLDGCHIASIQSRPERQIQFFDVDLDQYVTDAISLRRAPISIGYLSGTELIIMQKGLISIWSITYRSCIWSISIQSCPINFTYLHTVSSIAILTLDGIQLISIPYIQSGLSSSIGTGFKTRMLSGQAAPYISTPDTPAQYLQAIQSRPAHSALDLDKYHAQIRRCLTDHKFSLVADLIRAVPEHIPKDLLTQLLHLNQHELVTDLVPIITIDEEEIIQLLKVIRPDCHGQALFTIILSLPKTDSVIIRHLSKLSASHVADIFSSLTSLLKVDHDLGHIVNWICLLVDAHPMDFIHHEQCRVLLQEWEPVIQYMAETSFMAEKLVSLLYSYQRQNNLCNSPKSICDFKTDKIETISW